MEEISGRDDVPSSKSRKGQSVQNADGSSLVRREERLRRLIRNLEKSIERALASSPQIEECLSRIRAEGLEASLVLQATVACAPRGELTLQQVEDLAGVSRDSESFPMSSLDKKFLRSLKISVDEDRSGS